jgi:RNA-directed DNA polymerase
MPVPPLLNRIASTLIRDERSAEDIVDRLATLVGRRWPFLTPLVERYFRAFPNPQPRQRDVVRFLRRDRVFIRVWHKRLSRLRVNQWLSPPPQAQARFGGWELPPIQTAADLAAWLNVVPDELDWFADLKGITSKLANPRLAHYHRRTFVKRSGGLRLVEAPKRRLRQIQRVILSGILDWIPPHPAAHGFVKGRSIHTFIAPHTNQHVVLKMDLRNFFPSLVCARIQSFFRLAGYPETVADLLGGLSTTSVPKSFWSTAPLSVSREEIQRSSLLYSRRHVPQGAPTSPALANICAYRLDCRLTGLARSADAQYTRYADDLAFSGGPGFARCAERFATHVAAILAEEGFAAHHRKTRIMRPGVRQHLAGITVNRRANVPRRDFDRLKATLTNCARHGPSTQNHDGHHSFRQHLEGRVAFVESVNFAKAARLREILTRIDWTR